MMSSPYRSAECVRSYETRILRVLYKVQFLQKALAVDIAAAFAEVPKGSRPTDFNYDEETGIVEFEFVEEREEPKVKELKEGEKQ